MVCGGGVCCGVVWSGVRVGVGVGVGVGCKCMWCHVIGASSSKWAMLLCLVVGSIRRVASLLLATRPWPAKCLVRSSASGCICGVGVRLLFFPTCSSWVMEYVCIVSISCIVSGVISCCMIDRVWYMSAVLSTRSTVSALGSGRRGIAMTGRASDARMG